LSDLDRLGENTSGRTVKPIRIDEINVEGEHHARHELNARRFQGYLIRFERMEAISRIFQRSEPVAMDTALRPNFSANCE